MARKQTNRKAPKQTKIKTDKKKIQKKTNEGTKLFKFQSSAAILHF